MKSLLFAVGLVAMSLVACSQESPSDGAETSEDELSESLPIRCDNGALTIESVTPDGPNQLSTLTGTVNDPNIVRFFEREGVRTTEGKILVRNIRPETRSLPIFEGAMGTTPSGIGFSGSVERDGSGIKVKFFTNEGTRPYCDNGDPLTSIPGQGSYCTGLRRNVSSNSDGGWIRINYTPNYERIPYREIANWYFSNCGN